MLRNRCTGTKRDGTPCRSFAAADGLCQAHNPARAEAHREATRKGGESRSAARRAARLWAATGDQVRQDDLPAMLRAAILDVREGKIEPSVATAIASLAKTSVQLSNEIELEARLTALEAIVDPTRDPKIRRIG